MESNDGGVKHTVSLDKDVKRVVEEVETPIRNPDTVRYVERKMVDKGVHRLERHPVDGLALSQRPPKSGHGGRFTWEGPRDEISNELDPAPAAIDPRDPNYVDEEAEKAAAEESGGAVVGEVEVAKVAEAKEGVSRVEIRRRG